MPLTFGSKTSRTGTQRIRDNRSRSRHLRCLNVEWLEERIVPTLTTIGFEGLAGGTVISNQYQKQDITFSSNEGDTVTALNSTYNPIQSRIFPPNSGQGNALVGHTLNGDSVILYSVNTLWSSIGAYVTSLFPTTLTAFDTSGNQYQISTTGGNTANPNILLQINKPNIVSAFINTGDLFAIDDVSFNTQSVPSKLSLVSSSNPSTSGQPVTFTATVSGSPGLPKPTGTVMFYDGSTPLGTGSQLIAGVATLITANLNIGTNPITAIYIGDANYNDSTSNIIDQVVEPPQIVITNIPASGIFNIGADASMPSIHASLFGVTPDPGTSVIWTTEVDYLAADYPNDPGPGENLSMIYPSEVTSGTQYTPSFKDENGDVINSGGNVTITAVVTVNGQKVNYQTNAEDDGVIAIQGTNPTQQAVENYVATIAQPSNWPSATQYNYHTIIDKIISKESSFIQFTNGEPKWSSDGLHGVGFMQVTNPAPTIDDAWNWMTNINDGVNLFNQKLTDANSYGGSLTTSTYINVHLNTSASKALKTQIMGLQVKNGLDSLTLAQLTPDQIVRQAIRGFNGGVQFTPSTTNKGVLVITLTGPKTGVINWVERNDGPTDYVQNVLSQNV